MQNRLSLALEAFRQHQRHHKSPDTTGGGSVCVHRDPCKTTAYIRLSSYGAGIDASPRGDSSKHTETVKGVSCQHNFNPVQADYEAVACVTPSCAGNTYSHPDPFPGPGHLSQGPRSLSPGRTRLRYFSSSQNAIINSSSFSLNIRSHLESYFQIFPALGLSFIPSSNSFFQGHISLP